MCAGRSQYQGKFDRRGGPWPAEKDWRHQAPPAPPASTSRAGPLAVRLTGPLREWLRCAAAEGEAPAGARMSAAPEGFTCTAARPSAQQTVKFIKFGLRASGVPRR